MHTLEGIEILLNSNGSIIKTHPDSKLPPTPTTLARLFESKTHLPLTIRALLYRQYTSGIYSAGSLITVRINGVEKERVFVSMHGKASILVRRVKIVNGQAAEDVSRLCKVIKGKLFLLVRRQGPNLYR